MRARFSGIMLAQVAVAVQPEPARFQQASQAIVASESRVPVDSGETRQITLTHTAQDFERWTAHTEIGRGEHAR